MSPFYDTQILAALMQFSLTFWIRGGTKWRMLGFSDNTDLMSESIGMKGICRRMAPCDLFV